MVLSLDPLTGDVGSLGAGTGVGGVGSTGSPIAGVFGLSDLRFSAIGRFS
jgi:hypothetical protein